jgi:hypothetical protein
VVRDHPYGEPGIIPREQWCLARDQNGVPVPDALVAQRFLLDEDLAICLDLAAARYDACRHDTAST